MYEWVCNRVHVPGAPLTPVVTRTHTYLALSSLPSRTGLGEAGDDDDNTGLAPVLLGSAAGHHCEIYCLSSASRAETAGWQTAGDVH